MNYPGRAITLNDTKLLTVYYNEVRSELDNILAYWMRKTHDRVNGGFTGQIDENNIPLPGAPKGAVLNARILWAFSAAYKITNDAEHLHLARIAFNYLTANFIDKAYGGIFWTVNAQGRPLDTKKQIYALAFAIYGCSAFFEISNNEAAKNMAVELYRQIETHSFDTANTGYLEAFTRNWQSPGDLRLSDKDANEKKTMNTHLHILEAYTALYQVWPDEKLKTQIKNLIQNFKDHIVDGDTGHLILFFDEQWNRRSGTVSYGHDIEAAWLLLEASETIKDGPLIEAVKKISLQIGVAATEGLDKDGGLWYEYETTTRHLIKEKHWWVQAEAMVGFFNHWQLTKDETYLQRSLQSWHYTNTFIKDKIYGEWLWGRNEDGTVMKGQDKVGIWKCPYHNSRACIEIIKRLKVALHL
ncbi:MAG: AGE family epimerase/isomerase [Ferruginibacter sp.]